MRSSPSIERPTELDEDHADVTVRTKAIDAEDLTRILGTEAPEPQTKLERVFTPPRTEHQRISNDMLEELRRRLREAEAREDALGSGIRERPTPEDGLPAGLRDTVATPPTPRAAPDLFARDIDPLADLQIDVDAPSTLGEWAQMLGAPREVEVALAPHSESNFYGGFDEEYPDGVFVATYQAIPADTPVFAVVHLPGGYRFRTPALVEFARPPEYATPDAPPGIGLRMCGLDGRMRRLIREFAKHRPPMFYIG